MDVSDVKKISECVEIAIMDAHDEEEQAEGWCQCLSDALSEIDDVEILGDIAQYQGVVLRGNQVLAKIRRNKKSARVSLDSLTFLHAPRHVGVWVKAYNKYWI